LSIDAGKAQTTEKQVDALNMLAMLNMSDKDIFKAEATIEAILAVRREGNVRPWYKKCNDTVGSWQDPSEAVSFVDVQLAKPFPLILLFLFMQQRTSQPRYFTQLDM